MPPATTRFDLGSIYLAYTVSVTLAVWFLTGSVTSLFSLEFGFGPKIALVAAGEPLGDGTRLPFIPYFLGSVASVRDDYLFALLLKNLVLQALPAYVLARLWLDSGRSGSVLGLLVYLLTFPQLVRHGFSLIPEEGYLVPMLAFVFWGFIEAGPGTRPVRLVPYALVTALAFLVKGSMLLVGPVLCLMYALKTRSFRVLLLFFGLFAAAVVAWGLMNYTSTGVFAVTSSTNGYDFWKGNNERTLDFFPHRTLDEISRFAPRMAQGQDEWEWSAECFRRGLSFNLENPWDAARIMAMRIYQVFFAVTGEESPSRFAGRAPLKTVGVFYMAVFRVLLFIAIARAVLLIWRYLRQGDRSAETREAAQLAVGYLAFLAAFVAPYLVAWGTERRLMPLIIPTCLYLWSVFRAKEYDRAFGEARSSDR